MTAITETRFTIDSFDFLLTLNPASPAAYMQRDLFLMDGDQTRFVESFFFDDIQNEGIQKFCDRFVDDAAFRAATFIRTTDRAICNDLFLRNCFNAYYQPNPFLMQAGSLVRAYYFFVEHANAIVADATYQAIRQHDYAMQPHANLPDPLIAPIINRLNQIDGVATLASCQGVSGVVHYQGMDVMTLSPHARFAYIWFKSLPQSFVDRLTTIALPHVDYLDAIYPALQSTGDNAEFLADVQQLIN